MSSQSNVVHICPITKHSLFINIANYIININTCVCVKTCFKNTKYIFISHILHRMLEVVVTFMFIAFPSVWTILLSVATLIIFIFHLPLYYFSNGIQLLVESFNFPMSGIRNIFRKVRKLAMQKCNLMLLFPPNVS